MGETAEFADALTVADYTAAGIEKFDDTYLADVNTAIFADTDRDTIGKIRAIVNSVVFAITVADQTRSVTENTTIGNDAVAND